MTLVIPRALLLGLQMGLSDAWDVRCAITRPLKLAQKPVHSLTKPTLQEPVEAAGWPTPNEGE